MTELHDKIRKLPKWAQDHIASLARPARKETA